MKFLTMTPYLFWAKPNKSRGKAGVASDVIHFAPKQCRNGEMSHVHGKIGPSEIGSGPSESESESGKCSDSFCSKAMP